MRIHELAKSEELETKEVIKILGSLGIKNKKSANKLSDEELGKFHEYVENNLKRHPEVALIKKKEKKEPEEHKKIVIKKKKVIILKKLHKVEPKKVQTGTAKEEASTVALASEKATAAKKERPGKEPTRAAARSKRQAETEEKKSHFKLKEKKAAADKEKGVSKKFIKKKHGYRRYLKEEEEKEHLDKLLQYKKKDARTVTANPIPKEIEILETVSVGELARKMNLKASDLISKLITLGVMARINDQIDSETATRSSLCTMKQSSRKKKTLLRI